MWRCTVRDQGLGLSEGTVAYTTITLVHVNGLHYIDHKEN